MKNRFNLAIALMALCAPLSAQNINQSVQVTNDYVTRFADFQKQGPALQVPDSLYRFDYNFDYSVFETPYKGSYEFSPYRIAVKPEARLYDGSKFFLRAGAGYTVHPQFEMAWQMMQEPDFAIGVFAEAGGFLGNYRRRDTDQRTPGYDLSGRIGVGGQYLRPAVRLSYHFGYEGIFAGERAAEPDFRSGFNSAVAAGRIQSRERPENHLFYDFDLQYRYSGDGGYLNGAAIKMGENNTRLAVSVGPVLDGKYKILLDGLFEMESLRKKDASYDAAVYGELFGGKRAVILGSVKPHLEFLLGPVRLDAGLRMDWAQASAGDPQFTLAPDVTARLALLDANLELYAGVSGGQNVESHYAIKQINHFSHLAASSATLSREKLRVRAGLQGHWNSRLQYELEAGYVSYLGKPLAGYHCVLPVDYKAAYGQARVSWRDARFELDGALSYAYMKIYGTYAAYAPPAFTADVRGRYNWDKRIWFGAFLEAASSRMSLAGDGAWIPWYINQGLEGEYRIDSRWTVWAEAGNLLGMAIERAPGYIEKGPYVTVGLTLKF